MIFLQMFAERSSGEEEESAFLAFDLATLGVRGQVGVVFGGEAFGRRQ